MLSGPRHHLDADSKRRGTRKGGYGTPDVGSWVLHILQNRERNQKRRTHPGGSFQEAFFPSILSRLGGVGGHSKQAQRVPVRGVLLEEGGGLGISSYTPKVLANNPRSICGLHGFPAGPRGC